MRRLLFVLLLLAAGTAQAARFTCNTISFVDSETGGNVIGNIQDSDTGTIWESDSSPAYHSFNCDLGSIKTVDQICYTASASAAGRVNQYQLFTSADGANWGAPAFASTFTNTTGEQCAGTGGLSTRYIRMVIVSAHSGTNATIAELQWDESSPPADPTSTTVTVHNGDADINFSAGAGGGSVTDYQVQCKLDGDPDANYGLVEDTSGTSTPINANPLENNVLYDCRIRARGSGGNSAWVTTGLQDFRPSAYADYIRLVDSASSNDRIYLPTYNSSTHEVVGCSDPSELDDAALCVQDQSGNGDNATNATAANAPLYDTTGGIYETGATAGDEFDNLALGTGLTNVGPPFSVSFVVRLYSSQIHVIGSDSTAHAIRIRNHATTPDTRFRLNESNVTVSGFSTNTTSGAYFFVVLQCESANLFSVRVAEIGTNFGSPTENAFSLEGVNNTAGICGASAFDWSHIFNNAATGNSLNGALKAISFSTNIFNTSPQLSNLYDAMLDVLRD